MKEPLLPTNAELAHQPETGTGELRVDLLRRVVAEALGTALLIVAVVGSGIMASALSPEDIGLQLLENAAATAAALIGLILMFGSVSGAHFNPVVTLVDRLLGTISTLRHGALRRRADRRRLRGHGVGQPHVRARCDHPVHQGALLGSPVVVRGDRHHRAAAGDPRLCAHRPRCGRPLRRGHLDRRRLLVHQLHELRQPCRHRRPHAVGHLRRHQTLVSSDVHRHAAPRRPHRVRTRSLPLPPPRPRPTEP